MIYVVTISLYLAFMVAVSIWRSRQVRTQDDFMVAGRGVSTIFLVGTLVCTWIGSGSLFGGAGRAFRNGFSALWMSAGAWVGIALVWFLAHRVRRIAQYTVPDILETRYTPAARLLGTFAIVLAYLTIASYQFIGGGRLLHILTGIDPLWGQLLTCVLVVAFTVLAGMMSIVTLDVFNGLLILGGIAIAAPVALGGVGGWAGLVERLPASHFSTFGTPGFLPALGLFFPTFFLLMGESSMYQKFMSARDEHAARRAVVGMIVGVIVVETLLAATAVFGAAHYWNDPAFVHADGSFETAATETVLLEMARHVLPPAAGLLLLTGGVAIIFSTANTFLMIPSTNLVRDVYQRFLRPEADGREIVLAQRLTLVALAAVSFAISNFFESILDMSLYAYTMVGAAITPALLAALLWPRATPAGGTASIATGVVLTIVFAVLASSGLEALDLGLFRLPLDYDYIIYPAGSGSIAALFVVSSMTKPRAEEPS
jgi:SSS family solute:Na+ symporter/sodium/proline symporter